jgi:hypothetical protein
MTPAQAHTATSWIAHLRREFQRLEDRARPHLVGRQPGDNGSGGHGHGSGPDDRVAGEERVDEDDDREEEVGLPREHRNLGSSSFGSPFMPILAA